MPRTRSAEDGAATREASKRHKAEREKVRRANFTETQRERDRVRHRHANLTGEQIEQHRARSRTKSDMPKKKRHLPQRKIGKPIIIEDEQATTPAPSVSKAKPITTKPDDCVETLQMMFWSEDLSPAQLEKIQKRDDEYTELMTKLETLAKQNGGEVVHKGDTVTGFHYNANPPALAAFSQSNGTTTATQPTITTISQSNVLLQRKTGQTNTYQLVMDPRLGLIVGTMTPTNTTVVNTAGTNTATVVATGSPTVAATIRPAPVKKNRGRPVGTTAGSAISVPPPLQPFSSHVQPSTSTPTVSTLRPAENTAVGGLGAGTVTTKPPAAIVDLTADDGRPPADSREVAFNKLQGKTFPSLVVVARPHLAVKDAASTNDRTTLDAKVKSVLVHTPTKFTEWLIQQGLVRSEQHCTVHLHNKLNLGMYSDVSKFPYSGGYVWISECCPHRFVSVFNGSLFEGAAHPPVVLLKLIYHWACQTNIQNVVQWVKVDNLYVKGLFTWLRAVCSYALQQNLKPMGGPGKKIEVGVISLGTTSQDGSQRQVKVEVLGILDPEQRLIRLRAVEPLADGERNYKRRFSKILEPLWSWVHPESIIATDLTVDKGTLQSMGFNSIIQNTQMGVAGNQGVMEYLRKIVPRMFQNTLSLLSRQIIQQFLDELVWREWFGQSPAKAYNNMVIHLAEQTRMNVGESLIQRLNKVASNPFKNYALTYMPSNPAQKIDQPAAAAIKRYGRKRTAPAPSAIIDLEKPKKIHLSEPSESVSTDSMVPLDSYYYGSLEGDMSMALAQKVTLNVRCCVCKVPHTNNIQLLDHLLAHAHNISAKNAATQCKYCLAHLPTIDELNKHIGELHPLETRTFTMAHPACILCEQRFTSIYMLGKHMSKEHVPLELPYQCGTCGFRCSSHRQAVDHFYIKHDGAATVQCPFCLKCTAVWSSGRIMSTNVTFFLAHLQKHQKKTMAKKCYKCALWFIQKDTLKEHQQKAHCSLLSRKGVKPRPLPVNYVMVPKSKIYHNPNAAQSTAAPPSPPEVISQHKLSLVIPQNSECKECKKTILNAEHYPQKFSCSSCRYITDCVHSMQQHKTKCRKSPVLCLPRNPLASELHCVCGYANDCGNQMAKHLALCERKTAYATVEQAQVAAVDNNTHSMLDVLGLVRKNDDAQQEMEVSSAEEVTDKDEDPLPTTTTEVATTVPATAEPDTKEPTPTAPITVDLLTTETETDKSTSETVATKESATELVEPTVTSAAAESKVTTAEPDAGTVEKPAMVAVVETQAEVETKTPTADDESAEKQAEPQVVELIEDSAEKSAESTAKVVEPVKDTTETVAPTSAE